MIKLTNISKYYRYPFGDVIALTEISFHLMQGEYVSVIGPKSSGKSTLITLIGCMDLPTGGVLRIMDTQISGTDDRTRDTFRLDHMGLVCPELRLPSQMTLSEILQNQIILTYNTSLSEGMSDMAMDRVGIPHQFRNVFTGELSDEMQMKGSIARALVNEPDILLCDEPTKNLDPESSERILSILEDLNRQGMTIIMATEDIAIARRAQRHLRLHDGYLVGDKYKSLTPSDVSKEPERMQNESVFSLYDTFLKRNKKYQGMDRDHSE